MRFGVAIPAAEPEASRDTVLSRLSYQPPLLVHDDGRPWFIGTIDDVVDDIEQLRDAGVEHVTFRFRGDDVLDQLDAGSDVTSRLRR